MLEVRWSRKAKAKLRTIGPGRVARGNLTPGLPQIRT